MPLTISTRADDADKHTADVTALVYARQKLYSSGDAGKIKKWEEDLKLISQVDAHNGSIYSLTASADALFSGANDSTVKKFDLGTLEDKGVYVEGEDEIWKVVFSNGLLYVGDSQGALKIYKAGEDEPIGEEDTCDPIKDIFVSGNHVLTVKDLDVTITQFVRHGDNLLATSKKTVSGKAPLGGAGDKIFFLSRSGKDIIVIENSDELQFKKYCQQAEAHEMIINALVGTAVGNKIHIFSAGWDKVVKQWEVAKGEFTLLSSVDVGFVVNALALGEKGELYAGGGDGHIVRIDV